MKYDLSILDVVAECAGARKIDAAPCREIANKMTLDASYVYRGLLRLMGIGYVARGFREGREHTYYVTEEGVNFLEEVKK